MLNQITVMGRMVRDPELRHTNQNTPVCSFTIACDRDFADKDTGDRACDFIDCVVWRSSAEFVTKYFRKGNMAVVTGRLQMRDWVDNDGNKRRNAEIQVERVYFCEKKQDGAGYTPTTSEAPKPVDVYTDAFVELSEDTGDLPF